MAYADVPLKRLVFDTFLNKFNRFVDHPVKYDVTKHTFAPNKARISVKRLFCHFSTIFEDICGLVVLLGCLYSTEFLDRVLLLDKFIIFVYVIAHYLVFLMYYTLYTKMDSVISLLNDVAVLDGIFRGKNLLWSLNCLCYMIWARNSTGGKFCILKLDLFLLRKSY